MLEECKDLQSCEIILSEAIKRVRLVGEIPLSDSDIELLADFVHNKISPSFSKGTAFLRSKTPISFVCFLVGMGRFYDKQIGFWPIVEEKVGPIDLNWKVKWGKIFNQFLEINALPRFDEEEGLAYVNPILSHTCIPNSCLDEYFEQVVAPLVNKVLFEPLDREEILHELRVRRDLNKAKLELEKKKKAHTRKLKTLQQRKIDLKNRLEKYGKVAILLAEEHEFYERQEALRGLEESEFTRSNIISRMDALIEIIQKLESEKERLWREITIRKRLYHPILEVKHQIDDTNRKYARLKEEFAEALKDEKQIADIFNTQWGILSAETWNDGFGEKILRLPLERLLGLIKQYQGLKVKQKFLQERMASLESTQKEAIKPLSSILSLLNFIKKIWYWFEGKKLTQQPGELQQLQVTYGEIEARLQLVQGEINGQFLDLPLKELILKNPTSDLYEKLVSFRLAYERMVESRNKHNELMKEKGYLIGQAWDLISTLGIVVDRNLDTLVNTLGEVLEKAEQDEAVALKVEQIHKKEISPVLEAAQMEYQGLQTNLKKLDQQLAELGGGSTEQGRILVQEFHRFQASIAQARQNLNSRYPDLLLIESEIRRIGWDQLRAGLEETILNTEKQILALRRELEQIEHAFKNYPAQYFGVDEPVRRFLLYGGITAENYLVKSVMLFARVKLGEKIDDILGLDIPSRIIQRFNLWWDDYRTRVGPKSTLEEEVNQANGERFCVPQISFDITTSEVIAKLPSQRILRRDHETSVQIDVYCTDLSDPIYTSSLKLYNRTAELLETHSCDGIILTKPSEKYIFRLKSKENLIHEWEIQGLRYVPPILAFSTDSHKLIKGEYLPKAPLIIVVNEKVRIHPQECILTERCFLFGDWKGYVWYEVDLSTVDEFRLFGDDDQTFVIPLVPNSGSNIILHGGYKLAGVLSDERPVFNIPPESLRIQINNWDEIRLLRLSLFWEEENRIRKSKHYQVHQLINQLDQRDKGWFEIPLNAEQLLGTNPVGRFTLRVYRPPYLDWQQSFCIVPKLNISFDREMYLPYREKIPEVSATLTFPEKSAFNLDNPARLTFNSETSYTIQVQASESVITGMLICSTTNGDRINIPLTFMIPKLRWRLKGLVEPQFDRWFDEVKEELWIGDWMDAHELFLVVETPHFYSGEVSLVLPGNSISKNLGIVRQRKFRVDLKALEDRLRAGPSLETVTISLMDSRTEIHTIPLFTVRTRWQAEKIRCFYYPEGNTVRVDAFWREKGRANRIVARLWYLSSDKPKFIQEQLVSSDEQQVTFRSTAAEIKSGKYLVHLEPYDPWSSRAVCPKLNDLNTAIIEIVTRAPEKAINIRSVGVDPKHSYPLPDGAYRIHIIGKVINQKLPDNLEADDIDHVRITPLNENWYVGNLEVNGIPEVTVYLSDTNPVKFEYDTQKHIVTSIEDRYGDGAVYCYDCRILFWHQETVLNEKKRRHRNYGPIEEFWVSWESE